MMKVSTLITAFLATGLFSASAFEISGIAQGYEGKFIRLYVVSDFVSNQEEKLDVVRILEDGTFKLNGLRKNPVLTRLRIEDKTAELVVLPGKNLQIKLIFNEYLNEGRVFDKELTVEILNNESQEINELIWSYQKELAAFLERNHAKLVTKHILPEVQKFQIAMKALFIDEDLRYFRVYLEYSLGILEDAVMGSEKKIFSHYIQDRPIFFHNMAFMDFFVQFYQDRFIQIAQGSDGYEFLSAINGTQDYNKMMEIVTMQPYIGNDTLAQLFVIHGIKEVFGDEQFEKIKLLSMLGIVKEKGLSQEIVRIADRLSEELTFLSKGRNAPDFSLYDMKGKVHHLSDYEGKNVLLFFWSAQTRYSLKDLGILDDYQDKYKNTMMIIGVNVDINKASAEEYLKKSDHRWLALFRDGQYDVMDKYRIQSAPRYILIDDEGRILEYHAPSPEENLEEEIVFLTMEK